VSPIKNSAIDTAEFFALDYKVTAQLDLPYTLISRVFSTYPIKRHISRVSRPIKPPNTLIVSPIKDRHANSSFYLLIVSYLLIGATLEITSIITYVI
jgi:hypothetical protein